MRRRERGGTACQPAKRRNKGCHFVNLTSLERKAGKSSEDASKKDKTKATVCSELLRNDPLALLQEPCSKTHKRRRPVAYSQMKGRPESRPPLYLLYLWKDSEVVACCQESYSPACDIIWSVWLKQLIFSVSLKRESLTATGAKKPKTRLCLQWSLWAK